MSVSCRTLLTGAASTSAVGIGRLRDGWPKTLRQLAAGARTPPGGTRAIFRDMGTPGVRLAHDQNVRLMVGVLTGLTFGRVMSLIPSPHSSSIFWIGNLCAPWLVIAFAAGASQRTAPRAALGGLLAESSCVFGFYASFLFHGPTALGLPPNTSLQDFVIPALTHWLRFIAFWLVVATASGTVYGLLGHGWRRSAPVVTGLAVGLPFIAEPGLWTLRDHQFKGPWSIWALEVVFGLLLTAILILRSVKLKAGAPAAKGETTRS